MHNNLDDYKLISDKQHSNWSDNPRSAGDQHEVRSGRAFIAMGVIVTGAFLGYGKASGDEVSSAMPSTPSVDGAEQLRPVTDLSPEQYREAIFRQALTYAAMDIKETSTNHSEAIDEYFQMGLKGDKADWCASFISRVFYDIGAPFTGGDKDGYKGPEWQIEYVNNISRWVRDNNGEIFPVDLIRSDSKFTPTVGDIVVYNKDGVLFDNQAGVNHIGLVVGYDAQTTELTTIEGNYNDALAVRRRTNPFEARPGKRSDNIAGILRHPSLVESYPEYAENEQQKLAKMGVPPEVLKHLRPSEYFSVVELAAQLKAESGFRADAKSEAGAMGIAQFMPKTAEVYFGDGKSPYDIKDSLVAQRQYMDYLYEYVSNLVEEGTIVAGPDDIKRITFAAYNAGPGSVKKHGGIPEFKETKEYLRRIYGYIG